MDGILLGRWYKNQVFVIPDLLYLNHGVHNVNNCILSRAYILWKKSCTVYTARKTHKFGVFGTKKENPRFILVSVTVFITKCSVTGVYSGILLIVCLEESVMQKLVCMFRKRKQLQNKKKKAEFIRF